ncbi:MAG: NAD(P)(+) transhydrogenase (Re/Si-specific) subunit beta [Actinomycetota bacterium]|nr:NAD(P)(+) transhydrogenase (Re/Si-specific) subunit beta [Actinomycetota bacterium]
MSGFDATVRLLYVAAAACFVVGLHLMNAPPTANKGSRVSATGMVVAVAATIALVAHDTAISATGWTVMLVGAILGSAVGLAFAQKVKMTAIPQLVSLFNAMGGGAAALVALAGFVAASSSANLGGRVAVSTAIDVAIGAVTFSGSVVASGKLQGTIAGRPIIVPGGRLTNSVLALATVVGAVLLAARPHSVAMLVLTLAAALAFGVAMVLRIGGADMPVVISLLNALTGTAVAVAGFVIDNSVLIIAGALVGASGGILTKLMADAMNRSIVAIMSGGFGGGDSPGTDTGGGSAPVRQVSADDAAIQLAYASKVVIVPGYGLAAAQAQHAVRDLAQLLEERGIEVSYAIHPVAGRMPGHMNVLLAEADVPYTQLKPMDEINPEFPRTDVALVIGANDVINPAARRPGTAVSGMPILDVDQAKSVIVIKRSMGHGYAGIENELYTDPKTSMFFADAKAGLVALGAAVKTLVGG